MSDITRGQMCRLRIARDDCTLLRATSGWSCMYRGDRQGGCGMDG